MFRLCHWTRSGDRCTVEKKYVERKKGGIPSFRVAAEYLTVTTEGEKQLWSLAYIFT